MNYFLLLKNMKLGEELPLFELKDQNNQLINSHSWLGKPVVVYFFPNDYTPICTAQACSFRNRYDEFQDLSVRVIGISPNSTNSHSKFAGKYNLPFTLLSDEKNEVSKLFGVARKLLGLSAGRVTYVFDKEGTLIYIHDAFLKAKEHIQAALNSLNQV